MEKFDATKIADFQKCAQLYDYKHNQGYRKEGDAIDITFGHIFGGALELFEKHLADSRRHKDGKSDGNSWHVTNDAIDAARDAALQYIAREAVNPDGSHKFGHYETTWRCLGTEKYTNEKGNAAKCPYSHKGKYFIPPAPDVCSCGSKTETLNLWVPTKATKDIERLVELVVGYTDGAASRALVPVLGKDGPMVEHYWEASLDLPGVIRPVVLCGNLDIVKSFGKENYIVDYKTTGRSLDASYWSQFTPNVQVDFYNMAAAKALPNLDIRGVAIEAFSTSSVTSGYKLIQATPEQKAEMFKDTVYWIESIQSCQDIGYWPRNRTSCFMCDFQKVCSRPPEERQAILDNNYRRAKWNPTTRSLEPIEKPAPTGIVIPFTPKSTIQSPTSQTSTVSSDSGEATNTNSILSTMETSSTLPPPTSPA